MDEPEVNDDNASVLADILPEVRRDTLGRRVPESKRRPDAFHAGKHKRGDNAAAATRARQDDKAQAQIQVLGYLRQGLSPEDAMLKTGRAGKTFYTWTRESTKFRVQAADASEAWQLQKAKMRQPWTEQIGDFEPVVRKDFKTWAEYVVAFRKAYLGFDTFDHQWRILQAWENAPGGGITMILLPPEGGKSTLLADAVTADLCDNPNNRMALISEGQEAARKILGRIQRRMEIDGAPTRMQIDFGPFRPLGNSQKKWNADEFRLLASTHDESDASCVSVGIKGNIRGSRWDRVYLDDVQSVRNESQTSILMRIFRNDVITRPNMQSGKIIVTGSRVGRNDFYGELERLDIVDEIICIPALDLTKPIGHQSYFPRQFRAIETPEGEVLTPILDDKGDQLGFSDEDFAQRRKKVGEDEWQRVYMQRPQSEHAAKLTDEDILNATDAAPEGHPHQKRMVGWSPKGAVGTIAGLDPSLANHAAYTYCAYNAEYLFVVDLVDLFKPTVNRKIYEEIERGTKRYHPDYWVIENNTLQSGYLSDDAFLEIKARHGFRAVGHHTGDNKKNSELGIPAMMDAIVRGEIRFPVLSQADTAFVTLYEQLKAWREDIPTKRLVQDQVMSLWFCYLRWRQLRQLVDRDLTHWKRPGLERVTIYPHAQQNVQGLESVTKPAPVRTYEQEWAEHVGKAAS